MMQQWKQDNPTLDELRQRLREKGVNLSHQRLKVLEYLLAHEGHPSADQIYRGLRETMATLSITTVYNTLNLLAEAGGLPPAGARPIRTGGRNGWIWGFCARIPS